MVVDEGLSEILEMLFWCVLGSKDCKMSSSWVMEGMLGFPGFKVCSFDGVSRDLNSWLS